MVYHLVIAFHVYHTDEIGLLKARWLYAAHFVFAFSFAIVYYLEKTNTQTQHRETMTRLLKILVLMGMLALAIYWRFFYDFQEVTNKIRIMHTLLSISILLLLFRIIIDCIALWYKIDRKHGSGKLRDNLIVGLSNLFSIIFR